MKVRSAAELLLPKTYEDVWYRGEAYVERGLVTVAKKDAKEVRALVAGTEQYVVSLTIAGAGLLKKCTCPYAAGGGSRSPACKHMVAVAIWWDELRHLPRPTREEIETESIPPPLVSRFDIERAFQNPVTTNLEIIRLASGASGQSTRPHERLPLMPPFETDASKPLTLLETRKAFRALTRWSKLPSFDLYYCAGEMVAAFSEVIRLAISRITKTDPVLLTEILLDAQKFHYELVGKLIDDSDGLHVFSEAHLDEFRDIIKKKKVSTEDRPFFEQKLWNYEVHRDDY